MSGMAKGGRSESVKGSIEVRKVADFAIISADYLTIPAKQIESLKALATYVGGRMVYQDKEFSNR